MEAKYANQMSKKGKLKLVFVMMESNYTTVSTPDCCDGWLGIMLGDQLWYPLWDENQVESTARQLASMIGSSSKAIEPINGTLTTERSSPAATTKPSQSSITLTSKVEVNHTAAYEMLLTPERMIDSSLISVKKILEEWGVLVAEDLGGLLPDDIIALTELMKKAQRKKFLALFRIDMDSTSHDQAIIHSRLNSITNQLLQLTIQVSSIGHNVSELKDDVRILRSTGSINN
jgi:hypothetical protein